MTISLKNLAGIRSQYAENIINFLQQYANTLNEPPPFVKSLGLDVRRLEVEQWVWTEKIEIKPSKSGFNDSGDRSELEKIVQELYEIGSENRKEERWANVVNRRRARLILLGAPGQGKTFSTKATVLKIIDKTLSEIKNCQRSIEEIPIAIWIKASVFTKTGAGNLVDALIKAMRSTENQTPIQSCNAVVEQWLCRRLKVRDALVIVDSLDEVDRTFQGDFYEKSQMFDNFSGKVVITCRTINWQEKIGWIYHTQRYKEIELVPFKLVQQREFADNFFTEQTQHQRINKLFKINYAMQYAARTPLLMTFICLGLRSNEIHEKTTYSGLYDIVIRNIMSGAWKNFQPTWSGDDEKQAEFIDSMARVVWKIFLKSPEKNRFSSKDWREAISSAKDESKNDWFDFPRGFLKQLTALGLIIQAGYDGIYPCYSFAHRTILEYLAARRLGERTDWIEIIYPHLWFETGWVEISKFLVGLVENTTLLLEQIEREDKDLFGWKLSLQFRIVGFASYVDDNWRKKILKRINNLYIEEVVNGQEETILESLIPISYKELAVSNSAQDILKSLLADLINSSDHYIRWKATTSLGEFGVTDDCVIETLLDRLVNDSNDFVRSTVAATLGKLAVVNDRVIKTSMDRLVNEPENDVRFNIAETLGRFGIVNDRMIEVLMHNLLDDSNHERFRAAQALVQIGVINEQVIETLIDLLILFPGHAIADAAKVLRQIDGVVDRVIKVLLDILEVTYEKDSASNLRHARAVEALGKFGVADDRVIEVLLNIFLNHSTNYVRYDSAEALGLLGIISDPVIEAFLKGIFDDSENFVRTGSFQALKWLGVADSRVTDTLLDIFVNHSKDYMRHDAAEVLVWLGVADDRVLEYWLHALANYSEMYPYFAADALGRIGQAELIRLKNENLNRHCQTTVIKEKISRIMNGLIEFSSKAPSVTKNELWRMMWQIPPDMKTEYLAKLRTKSDK